MKNTLFAFFLVTLLSLGYPNSSVADSSTKDDVTDSEGQYIVDSFGHCVRTKWEAGTDKCNPHVQEVVEEARQPSLVDILKVEERTAYFTFDGYKLDNEEEAKLSHLAGLLKEHKIKRVKIVGYTDVIGNPKYNEKLSLKRANAVKKYIDSLVQLEHSPVELRGLGESNPIVTCESKSKMEAIKCLAPNRRVEVEIDYMDQVLAN